jgi:hypothetical protein
MFQIEIDMDGTSGALYSIYMNGLASGLRSAAESQKSDTTTPEVWAEALVQARDTLYQYTRGECHVFCLHVICSNSRADESASYSLPFLQRERPLGRLWTLWRRSRTSSSRTRMTSMPLLRLLLRLPLRRSTTLPRRDGLLT